jgi:hypothetical protein
LEGEAQGQHIRLPLPHWADGREIRQRFHRIAVPVKQPHSLQKDNRETLDVTYRIYLLDGSQDRKIDVVGRRTRNFGNESYSWGWHASHDELKKALQSDGSLLVAADVEFLVPYDSKVKEIFEGCAPSGDERDLFTKWQSSVSKLRETGDHSDCTLMVG